jgi:hypothetical protein
MIDAIDSNEDNENLNNLLDNVKLPRTGRYKDVNKSILDALVKHRKVKIDQNILLNKELEKKLSNLKNLLNKTPGDYTFSIEDIDAMIADIVSNEDLNSLLKDADISSADRTNDVNKRIKNILVNYRQKKLFELKGSVSKLITKTLENSNFSIETLNEIIDAVKDNQDNDTLNVLINKSGLSSLERTDPVNINILDAVAKYKKKKLSKDYSRKINANRYPSNVRVFHSKYIDQMNVLTLALTNLLNAINTRLQEVHSIDSYELTDIKAICNYNVDQILRNNTKISPKEFKDQFFAGILKDAKRANIDDKVTKLIIENFNKNKYFTSKYRPT